MTALGLSTSVAAIGLAAFAVSTFWPALSGVAAHILVAGAIWPTAQRLEAFARPRAADDGGR